MKKSLSKLIIVLTSVILILCTFQLFSVSSKCYGKTNDCFSVSNQSIELPIIMYHSVLKNKSNMYITKLRDIQSDFEYLKSHGYTPITMNELINYVKNDGEIPSKPIMITFDDGFYNNYVYVFPLLKKYNFKAVISVVGAFTELNTENEPQNANYSYLSWSQISEMGHSDYVEIQNHTYNLHSNGHQQCGISKGNNESLSNYKNRLTNDITKLQGLLKQNCGIIPNTFTYPYGIYNKTAETLIENLGFQAMLTCSEGINTISKNCSLTQLKRFNRSGNISTQRFFQKTGIE